MRSMSARSPASARIALAPWPMTASASSSFALSRPVMNTRAPSSAKRLAAPSPMPALPPVTTATLPSSFLLIVFSFQRDQRTSHAFRLSRARSKLGPTKITVREPDSVGFTDSRLRRSGRYRVGARSAAGGVFRAGGNRCPRSILLQQVDRDGKENHVLHQEWNVAGHRRKSAGGRSPAVRHEWDDRDGHDERQARARRPESSQGLVPEADEDERAEQPLGDSEEPTRAPDAEYWVHPGDERAVADEGNQRLRL